MSLGGAIAQGRYASARRAYARRAYGATFFFGGSRHHASPPRVTIQSASSLRLEKAPIPAQSPLNRPEVATSRASRYRLALGVPRSSAKYASASTLDRPSSPPQVASSQAMNPPNLAATSPPRPPNASTGKRNPQAAPNSTIPHPTPNSIPPFAPISTILRRAA